MARAVMVNPADKIIRVFGEDSEDACVNVHRHLLFDRSTTNARDGQGLLMETGLRKKVKLADIEPGNDRLEINLPNLDERALEMYAASLYGQSMWDDSEADIEDELRSLVRVHQCCECVSHTHGQDESVDAIRSLIKSNEDDMQSPLAILLDEGCSLDEVFVDMVLDFIVYGNVDDQSWMYGLEPMPDIELEYPGLVRRLCAMFLEKAANERNGIFKPATALDQRCRYHYHLETGEECYLDKKI
ncbi:hypothetical protein Q7P37_001081 [Cladosporium fusiforme]